jgi:hypothetical protein
MMPPISMSASTKRINEKRVNRSGFLVSRQHSTHTLIERAHRLLHFENHGLESGAVEDATFAIERVRHDSWTLKRPVEPSQDLTRKLGKGRLGDAVVSRSWTSWRANSKTTE